MKPRVIAAYRTGEELRSNLVGMNRNGWLVEYDGGRYMTDDWRDAVAHALTAHLPWEESEQASRRQYQHVGFACTWPIPMRLGVFLIPFSSEEADVIDGIRLCVESGHPIDPGNYRGPIHCTAHPEGYPCTTAMYERVEGTMSTAADRQAANTPRKAPS